MIYRISIVLIWSCMLIPMSGCIVGNRIEQEKLSLLKENQTTKAEAIKLLGEPDDITPGENGKGEFFTYWYSRSGILGDEIEKQTVSLFIDDTGIVRKIAVLQKPERTSK